MDFKQNYIDEIINDRESGASELARRCLEMCADIIWKLQTDGVSEMKNEIEEFVHALQNARPSMSPIKNLLQTWLENLKSLPTFTLQEFRLEAMGTAEDLIERSKMAVDQAADSMFKILKPNSRIMTYSYSSTVMALMNLCKKSGMRVVVPEGRPLFEGRKFGKRISDLGIETTVITESQIGICIKNVDVVVVGADTVVNDGSVVNKAGTSLLALAAQTENVPVYVVYEKFKKSNQTSAEVVLEKMPEDELGVDTGKNLHIYNYYFDITPAERITAWITEDGVRLNKGKKFSK
ncbi:MAG: hypothetical protein DWQ05_08645 [Calditrichaeota bacterium]|nr:MAG: hypothetical protein DWQ05_08645 [Calditrichota bacterium]